MFKVCRSYVPFLGLLFTVMLIGFGSEESKGQDCIPKKRKYATRQESYGQGILGIILPGTISDGNKAIDADLKSYSTLSVPVGLLNLSQATQYLEFTSGSTYIAANTPVTVKLSLPTSILGVLDNVKIQPFINLDKILGRWQADAVGSPFTGAALVNLVNGVGELEFTVTPNQQYQGIWINIGSVVGLGVSAKVYSSYILEDDLTTTSCNTAVDVLAGVKAGAIGGVLDATSSIINQYDAVDSDPLTTYAELNAGVNLVGEIFHTTIFKTTAQPGDIVKMIVEKPGGGLLNLAVLSGFTIQLYNGATPIGDPLTSSSTGLLSLNLLPGAAVGETKRELIISVPKTYGAYDRVQVKIGGVATVGLEPGLRIYDVKRIISPKILIDNTLLNSKAVCQGNTATLSIQDPQDCTTYDWYKTSTGGSKIATATSYTPPVSDLVVGDNIFYVEAIRNNCSETSERVPITIKVNPLPTVAAITGSSGVCVSQTTILSSLTTGGAWSTSDATKATVSVTGVVTGVATGSAVITYTITDPITGCSNSVNKNITINPLPNAGSITGNSSVCVNQTITLSNNVPGGIWASTDNSKATINSSGTVTGISKGETAITYTVTSAGCSSVAAVVITVNPIPNAAISGTLTVCQGTLQPTITFTGSNGTAPYTFTYNIDGGISKTISTTIGNDIITLSVPTDSQGTFNYNLLSVMDSSSTQCSNTQTGTATITVSPKPPAPHVAITTNSQY